MPDPPVSSWPDQLTVNWPLVSVAGSGPTLLVGGTGVDRDQGLLGGIDPLARVLVVDLVGGDGRFVESDLGHVGDLRAGGQAGFGLDDVIDVSLAAAGAVFRGQETGQDVGGKLVAGSTDWNVA